ncbi:hypothetical protein SAY86_023108 [Trapa natans]|uniref:non-specific serine/threonine protein kinase n=1 Tax=Trapa natans TaxID=22666 RepID=A0AAN7LPG6_TRANT|nr:hypothetical protein SAY86_023108 [Trapa natans]
MMMRKSTPTGREGTTRFGLEIRLLAAGTLPRRNWDRASSPPFGLRTTLNPLYVLPCCPAKYVALKIQKSAAQFVQAALHEIEVLSVIADEDISNSRCVVRLVDHFKHTGPNGQHLCMVLEFLGDSLLRMMKYNRYKGIELNKVREICICILIGLDYLHRELGIIHTDLKPENILLSNTIDPDKDPVRSGASPILERPEGNLYTSVTMSIIEKKLKRRARRAAAKISGQRSSTGGATTKPERSMEGIDVQCKIVDFGNACWADKPFAEEIQTRQYRAPEVILQSGYSFSVDMWSFACTAFELATGDMMFAPKGGQGFSEDEDHLALMMELLGKIPKKVKLQHPHSHRGARSKDLFDKYGDLKRIRRLKFWPLVKLLMDKYKFSEADAREFSEFLAPLLDFVPENRPTAQQCLEHPWLSMRRSSAQNEMANKMSNSSNIQKVETGMRNLQIKVGK